MAFAKPEQSSVDAALVAELERIFKEEFLKAAPLYQACSKVKLPYEDLHRPTLMYRGSLREETRIVDQIADYESFKTAPEVEELIELATKMGGQAGAYVDGAIRTENCRTKGADPRDVRNTKAIDVFEHTDGRRNLQVFLHIPPMSVDPQGSVAVIFGYKFFFATANVVLEYTKRANPS
jgi:hypothetical protein